MKLAFSAFLSVLFSVLRISPAWSATTQFMNPFPGQGVDPPRDEVAVYVTAYLKRLLLVSDVRYNFEAQLFVRLTWTDPRAATQIAQRTAEVTENGTVEEGTCSRWCLTVRDTCCDSIWLPALDFVNARRFEQGRAEKEQLGVGGEGNRSVFWQKEIQGVFHSPLNFRKFPFDSQTLHIAGISRSPSVRFVASAAAVKAVGFDAPAEGGDSANSWSVQAVALEAEGEVRADWWDNAAADASDPFPMSRNGTELTFYGGSDAAEVYSFFVCSIAITRLTSLYIYSYLVPLVVATLVSCTVFLMDGVNEVETRVSTISILFLAVTTLQWTINNEIPATGYRTIMDQQVLLSYIAMALTLLETVFVHYISRKDLAVLRTRMKSPPSISLDDVLGTVGSSRTGLQSQSQSQSQTLRATSEVFSPIALIEEIEEVTDPPPTLSWSEARKIQKSDFASRFFSYIAEKFKVWLGSSETHLVLRNISRLVRKGAQFGSKLLKKSMTFLHLWSIWEALQLMGTEILAQLQLFLGIVELRGSGRVSNDGENSSHSNSNSDLRSNPNSSSNFSKSRLNRVGSMTSSGVQTLIFSIQTLKIQLQNWDVPGNSTRAAFTIDRVCVVLVPITYLIVAMTLYSM